MLAARAEAAGCARSYGRGRVFAYGTSAGGTLAALLAGDGLVAAAVAKAPISDLVAWEWPLARLRPRLLRTDRRRPAGRCGSRRCAAPPAARC